MNNKLIIKLKNSTLLLNLSTGPRYLTRENFGYAQISRKLNECKHLTEKQVLELIKVPPLPNGIYKFYMKSPTKYAIIQINKHQQVKVVKNSIDENDIDKYLIGVFAFLEDIKDTYPECFI